MCCEADSAGSCGHPCRDVSCDADSAADGAAANGRLQGDADCGGELEIEGRVVDSERSCWHARGA